VDMPIFEVVPTFDILVTQGRILLQVKYL